MEGNTSHSHETGQVTMTFPEGHNTISYILSNERPPNYQGDADPAHCSHDWYEDTSMVYTSSPPQRKQVCRLCGQSRFVFIQQAVSPRWRKVI